MRLLNPVSGTAAIRVTADEVLPRNGLSSKELIQFIADICSFQVVPTVRSAIDGIPVFPFQDGQIVIEDAPIAIQQFILFADGNAVVARDTDLAMSVMENLLIRLDEDFGYRYKNARSDGFYASALVAELDPEFVERHKIFQTMQKLANETAGQNRSPYRLKRISFSTNADPEPLNARFVKEFAYSDFTIERRIAAPLDRNIFFSTAPLPTRAHIDYLDRLEKAVIAA